MDSNIKLNINNINKQNKKHITLYKAPRVAGQKLRLRNRDILVYDDKNDGNILKIFSSLELNWLVNNKKILLYSLSLSKTNIENHLYASIMNTKIPKDLFEEVIMSQPNQWLKYQKIVENKEIYVKNTRYFFELSKIIKEINDIDLVVVIADEIIDSFFKELKKASVDFPVIIVTNSFPEKCKKDKYVIYGG